MSPTNDEIIKQDIVDQLTWDNSVDANDVNVNVFEGVTELTGTVPTYAAKMAAERDAYLIAGVITVDNNLTIEFPSGIALPTDVEITSNIENKLAWDSQINTAGIIVETKNSIVALSGVVDSYWEKTLAGDIAYYTHGVIDVVNNLTVAPPKSIVDIDIENDIIAAYKRSGLIDETTIRVSITDGVVHLTGTVSNYLEKAQAYNIAIFTAGVVDLINDITII